MVGVFVYANDYDGVVALICVFCTGLVTDGFGVCSGSYVGLMLGMLMTDV